MQFNEVRINNLFSYEGEQVFDFRNPEPKRNIVLISGRNGFGKTSFINSIKLLFAGITDSMLKGVQRGAKLSPKAYVLGSGQQWLGIMNRKAYSAGSRDCWIEIHWRENAGTVSVRRFWHLESGNFRHGLEVKSSFGGTILDEAAQGFLEERLPQDYIPFFFFDGEQIQAIAEANWSAQTQQMERILNISCIETLREYLARVMGEWRRNDMDLSAKQNLLRLEKEKAELLAREASNVQEQQEIQDGIAELEHKCEEDDRYFENWRAYSVFRDEETLKRQKKQLQSALEELQNALAETLPIDIPLVSCPNLLERGVRELRELIDSQSGIQVRLLEGFVSGLPVDLFDKPPFPNPPLNESQNRFYKNRLTRLLQDYIPDPEHIGNSIIRIEVNRARFLLPTLEAYLQSPVQRSQYVRDLRNISRMKRELKDIEGQLDNVSNISSVEQEAYHRRKTANDERRSLMGRHEQRFEDLRKEVQRIKIQIRDKERYIKEQEKKVILSSKAEQKIGVARQVSELFSRYKERLKQQYREAIEKGINSHFQQLMSAHGMIDHIHVLETFGLRYEDRHRNIIGMGSLSAAMKQLMATSLLWTLKEVSQKAIPLVIDTPLARIDLEHQRRFIECYYPNASEQVIILPTDSELDKEKYKMLLPHIYKEYRLENPDGESCRPILTPMYPLS